MGIKHSEFQFLLYKKFTIEKLYSTKDIAEAIGESQSTLYNYIEGVTYCPPDLIPRIYNATKDIDFLNFMVRDTDMMLTPRHAATGRDVIEEFLDLPAALGKLSEVVKNATSPTSQGGRRITRKELATLRGAAEDLHLQIEELEKAAEADAKGA